MPYTTNSGPKPWTTRLTTASAFPVQSWAASGKLALSRRVPVTDVTHTHDQHRHAATRATRRAQHLTATCGLASRSLAVSVGGADKVIPTVCCCVLGVQQTAAAVQQSGARACLPIHGAAQRLHVHNEDVCFCRYQQAVFLCDRSCRSPVCVWLSLLHARTQQHFSGCFAYQRT